KSQSNNYMGLFKYFCVGYLKNKYIKFMKNGRLKDKKISLKFIEYLKNSKMMSLSNFLKGYFDKNLVYVRSYYRKQPNK
ncbi:MAG: hypothetical protein IKY54_03660, partial [Muribaculaceae bacterium]|nr:hypothetical protein [Muribaculaceae bacterium]